jgi:hypothetical protein
MPEQSFLATDSFRLEHGRISAKDLTRLKRDIMVGKGTVIPNTNGLRLVQYGPEGLGAGKIVMVVYAVYSQYGLVVLLMKYQGNVAMQLAETDVKKLRDAKRKLDRAVSSRFTRTGPHHTEEGR